MARSIDAHLSSEEIQQFLASDESLGEPAPVLSSPAEFKQHLAMCELCRSRVEMYESEDAKLVRLKARQKGARTPQCPPEADWLKVAAGVAQTDETEVCLRHAATCDYCGPLLRQALEEMSPDVNETEAADLARLESGQAAWQEKMAARMSATARPATAAESSRATGWQVLWGAGPRWAFAACVTVAFAIGAWWFLRNRQDNSADRLLMEAYTQQRTLELRIQGARYAPMRIERGGERSRLERSPALLEAEAIIVRRLGEHPEDARWLQAKGRADLLDGNYRAAMDSLNHALEVQPGSPSLQIDLASAYFLRAETETKAADYGMAIDLLGRALQNQPNNPVALFNRAIALERMFLFAQAAEDWQHYLHLDPTGDWADEARRHLEEMHRKQQSHDKSVLEPLLQPAEVAALAGHTSTGYREKIDARFEEYQRIALHDWLPEAYPTAGEEINSDRKANARDALKLLASDSLAKHSDAWLKDLLRGCSSPLFPIALQALRNAIEASDHSDYQLALRESGRALRLFRESGNEAGSSRARFERIFALHFSDAAPECVREAKSLARDLAGKQYAWIRLQTGIEEGICQNLLSNFGQAESVLAPTVEGARLHDYPVTGMRAITMSALVEWSEGNTGLAWNKLESGVRHCWTESCPTMSLYSFYANMGDFAEDSHQWYLRVAVTRQAVLTLASDPHHLTRAVEHSRLGKAAMLTGLPVLAEQSFRESNRLLASVPQTEVTRNYQVDIQIDQAKLASLRGDPDQALKLLSAVMPRLSLVANRYLLVDYYLTLGQLRLTAGSLDAAETSLRWAVALAENELRSIRSPHDRLAWSRQSSSAYRELVKLELRRQNPQAALEIYEWYLGAPLRSTNANLSPAPNVVIESDRHFENSSSDSGPPFPVLHIVAPMLPAFHYQTFVSYAVISDKVGVWVFDDRGIQFIWLPANSNDLILMVDKFRHLCSSPDSDLTSLHSEGRLLYDSLLAPLAKYFSPGRTLVFEGDDEITDLPFQALIDPQGLYLADRYLIMSSPGLYYMARLKAASIFSANDRALVVDVPSLGKQSSNTLPPLPEAKDEAEAVAGNFQAARLLEGREANPQNLQREMRNAVVFHYAGHASASEQATGLLLESLTPEGPPVQFGTSRILSIPLGNIRLVVLSACSTEEGGAGGIGDPDSLVRAFLQSGVSQVVASRWSVNSATTVQFMQWFYKALLSGRTVVQALQEAEISVRGLPGAERPYYWAAFSTFGKA